jgi:carboxypeptidase Taq
LIDLIDMPTEFSPYEKLRVRLREIALVNSAANLLSWDQETYMPAKALHFRAEQMAFLTGWAHRQFTAPEVGGWIAACEQHGFPAESKEAVNVREWRRTYDRQTKLPTELVEEFQRAKTLARDAWVEARKRSDFPLFRPHLEKIVELNRRMADCWGYEDSPYDALLEEYETGTRAAQLRKLFAELRPAIVQLLGPAVERSAAIPKDFLEGDYPVAAQQAFNREVAEAIGFDFQAGRIDTTAHPFSTELGPRDCRLTTRYNEKHFTQSLYGILHEAGHGLYEQGLSAEDYGTPMGAAVSLGIHESQSRLWENHVGRSAAFWEHWHPVACRHFPSLARFTPAQIAAAVNRVSPSFIRVEADQVTYDLHIILRFEIEVRMMHGELKVADVPTVWNEEFEKMFGLKVPNDAQGCLQDIHWSLGTIGYFPTYTLGNLNAAQLFRRATMDHPELAPELRRGQYATLLAWLRAQIHQQGQRFKPQDLMRAATGEPTQAGYHLEHLRTKFAS